MQNNPILKIIVKTGEKQRLELFKMDTEYYQNMITFTINIFVIDRRRVFTNVVKET